MKSCLHLLDIYPKVFELVQILILLNKCDKIQRTNLK